MNIVDTPLKDLKIVETSFHADHRGMFGRLFCALELSEIFGARQIVQINQSRTLNKGALRGMHFQNPPSAEMKFVRCLKGRVFDVAVDIRKGSSTFLKWHGVELSAENGLMFAIPEGFAHGFQVLEPSSELLYLHTAPYDKEREGGLRHDDPALSIVWTLPVTDLSERDKTYAPIGENYKGITL